MMTTAYFHRAARPLRISGERSSIKRRPLAQPGLATFSLLEAPLSLARSLSTWVANSEAPNCNRCDRSFGIMQRRHHCRYCGQVFCVGCASMTIHGGLVPPLQRKKGFKHDGGRAQSVLRVCIDCDASVRGFCASLRLGSTEAAAEFLGQGLRGKVWSLAQDKAGQSWVHMAVLSGSTSTLEWTLERLREQPVGVLALKDRKVRREREGTRRWGSEDAGGRGKARNTRPELQSAGSSQTQPHLLPPPPPFLALALRTPRTLRSPYLPSPNEGSHAALARGA